MRNLLPILLVLISACSSTPRESEVATVAQDQTQLSLPWTKRFVDNSGVRIEYRVREAEGNGAGRTPVVFIPGMSADASVWENNVALVRALDAAGPRDEIRSFIAADYPPTVFQVSEEWASMVESIEPPILGRKSMDPEVEGRYAKAPRHQVLWIEHGHMTFTNAEAIAAAVAFQQSSD